ncbi:UvrD-helicase domain-containing protein [Alistipes sp. OttesenSCG-928-B03]|nr:UvrD-helicase domain-containing protein [Alistipes sp. OttesenSCG-928-B03]
MTELLKGLNQAQHDAVVNYRVPSLIVAGAGSGKTRVLTSRIAYMIQEGVQPWRILALTFTNKAAAEMRERIGQMVSREQSDRLWMGTFHSIFLKILRFEADKLGYPPSFTIYDTADSRNLLKTIIKEMRLDDDVYKPAAVQSRISLAKNNLVTAAAYAANTTYATEDRRRKMPEFATVYAEYARRCKLNGAMDFDDMLLNINILFKDNPDVLAKYQERFQYILVDEYQDTNYAQYIIIRRLAEHHSNVCVVGDDAQSIYSFRGAKIENILRFRNDFPDTRTFRLEQNYRSTQTIVKAANSVIERNKNRIEKECYSSGGEGEKIKVVKAYTDQEEASLVADELRRRVRECDAQWSDVALLYRTNMQSRVFEEAFRRRGIPYRIYGGMSFYQRKEIKDVLAYMHLIVNPRDDEAFKRVVNYPSRGIGDVTVGRMAEAARAKGVSLWEVASEPDLKAYGLNGGAEKKVREFMSLIEGLSAERNTMDLYPFGLEVATRSGIIGSYRIEQTPEAQSALDNIEELLNSMQTFADDAVQEMQYDEQTGELIAGEAVAPSLVEWLQSVTLLTDQDDDKPEERNKVTLMTIHAAKGLEYRFVFIVGLEENLFPSQMSMDGEEGIEEERRLFYVALTRAKEAAVMSFSETRFKWGSMEFCRPSRFLSEVDQQYLDIAFELEDTGEARPAETLRKNYRDHNERGREDREQRWSGSGPAGGYARRGDGADGYGQGKTERGAAAQRWKSPAAAKTSGAGGYGRPERVEMPKPNVGDGTRFKSMGKRVVAQGGDTPDTQTQDQAAAHHTVADSGNYAVGQRVAHAKFGIGTILSVEQMGADHKITVDFDSDGKRTLLTKFAKLAIVG